MTMRVSRVSGGGKCFSGRGFPTKFAGAGISLPNALSRKRVIVTLHTTPCVVAFDESTHFVVIRCGSVRCHAISVKQRRVE